MLAAPEINFHALIKGAAGKDGARTRFERLITQVVRLDHGAARRVEANPGDWGLDIIVGDFGEGKIMVWQAKYFIDGVGAGQKTQIAKALEQVMKKATEEDFDVEVWTLCIPVSLDPATTKWWDTWKKNKEKEHGIRIKLWDESELEARLLTSEATALRQTYFGEASAATSTHPSSLGEPGNVIGGVDVPVKDLPEDRVFDDMLFIKQLKAANVDEVESAKHQFFNADILSRDVADRGVAEEANLLARSRAGVHALWETRFSGRCATDQADDLLPGLHADVMTAIEQFHYAEQPHEQSLRMALVHRLGSAHELVELGGAGWVRRFREIAEGHGR